jgi:hypothetical protein
MSGMSDTRRLEYKLVHDALLLDIEVIETDARPTAVGEDWAVRIQLQTDRELIESSVHGVLFAIGALSFNDARPRGDSAEWFEPADQFTAADLLEHLRFEQGKLRLHVDYLRGRCVKTTVEVASDGRIRLETTERGKAAVGWVTRLQGKQLLPPR